MPTQAQPLPQLELNISLPELRALAFVLDRIVSLESYTAGLCLSVKRKLDENTLRLEIDTENVAYEFLKTVNKGMNPPGKNTCHKYIGSYLHEAWSEYCTDKELAAIRDAWAKHIARSIYEQIGD